MDASPILTLDGVTRHYGPRTVVAQASFALRPGRIACLLGPSGCGKSTILRMIAGLDDVNEGEIAIHGQTVSAPGVLIAPEQRGVGLVFQDNALFPHLTVRENVGFGVGSLGKAARAQLANELLARFQVDHLADKWPHTLSGGEQQRVAIARALAREPALLLLDEPFSGLDGHLRTQIRQSLMEDLREVGTTVLIVTHDPEEAMTLADDLILMADGRILQTAEPGECYSKPVSLVAARLLGDALQFPATILGETASTPFGSLPAQGQRDGKASMIVRPRDLVIAEIGMLVEVQAVRRLGHELLVTVSHANAVFSISAEDTGQAVGQTLHLQVRPGRHSFVDAGATSLVSVP